jgi:mRNA interferase MazF
VPLCKWGNRELFADFIGFMNISTSKIRKHGLAVVCPLTSKRKPYPFALPVKVDKVEGAILVDQLKSLDWAGRQAQFHSKAEATLLPKVRQYIAVLLGIR